MINQYLMRIQDIITYLEMQARIEQDFTGTESEAYLELADAVGKACDVRRMLLKQVHAVDAGE